MKNKFLFIIPFISLSLTGKTQNLVPNGSFEEVINCPSTYDALHDDCAHWFKSIQVSGVEMNLNPSPDWFHTCGTGDPLTPPSVSPGFQEPFEGGAYVGIVVYGLFDADYREIIGIELTEPLQPDLPYQVSFKVSKSGRTSHAIASNKVGVKFTNYPIFESSEEAINNFAHFHVDTLIRDTLNWVEISFEFVPDSGFQFLHIGNFFTDDLTAIDDPEPGFNTYSYYFVDDVKMEMLTVGNEEVLEKYIQGPFPNPCSDYAKLLNVQEMTLMEVRDNLGRIILSENLSGEETLIISTDSFQKGIYFIKFSDEKGNFTSKKLIKL